MRNSHEEVNKCGRFHIELSLTPDFDALVKLRKPKNVEKVEVKDGTRLVKNNKSESQVYTKKTVIKSLSTKQKTISQL